jgi:hypothetical protein
MKTKGTKNKRILSLISEIIRLRIEEYKSISEIERILKVNNITISKILKETGYPNKVVKPLKHKKTKLEKLMDKVEIDENGCWNWTGTKIPQGYGHTHYRGKSIYTHRLLYILTYGEIPEGLCCLHKCDNPSCCNPEHLFLGTMADNMHDRDMKGRDRYSKAKNIK